MHYLGIDFGLKYCGLAIGDDGARIATPFSRIDTSGAVDHLVKIIDEEGIDSIVVGVPVQDEGRSEGQVNKTTEFISKLKSVVKLPIYTQDERFTTAEANRLKEEFGADRSDDELAAMLILQSYFDEL